MSQTTTTLPGELASSPRPPLGARLAELLLIGGGTLLLFPLAWLARALLGRDPAEDAVDFFAYHAALVVNNPHFAVTYLLFYKDVRGRALGPTFAPMQRLRYLLAGFVAPLFLVGWAAMALATGSAPVLGQLVEGMFLLVGWHYVKQGFGILTVLSARRGVAWSARERWAVLAHCYAGWAYAWANPASPSRRLHEKGVAFDSLPRPPALELAAGGALALSTALLVALLVAKWRREGRSLPWGPLLGFFVTIWLWTIYSSLDPLMMYVIPALHSLQYLYFVWLLRRNEARASEGPPHFGKPVRQRLLTLAVGATALAWLLFRGLPGLLDGAQRPAPGAPLSELGPTPYLAAFFVVVNVHHYFMDYVIWRRENPDTRFLRDGATLPSPAGEPAP